VRVDGHARAVREDVAGRAAQAGGVGDDAGDVYCFLGFCQYCFSLSLCLSLFSIGGPGTG
jgi:hypothetical protein